jgi:hypothetical protein
MEIDALEQLISEDVKVQGQISCVMVSEVASWSLESSLELLPESTLELLPELLPEEMRSTSTTLLPGSSLEDSRRQCRGGVKSVRMKTSLLFPF